LGRYCHFLDHSQVGQKCLYLGCAHILGVFLVVEKNILFDPIQISLFSFVGILFQAQGIADSIGWVA